MQKLDLRVYEDLGMDKALCNSTELTELRTLCVMNKLIENNVLILSHEPFFVVSKNQQTKK